IFNNNNNMIVVTGAAGFIGSCLVGKLNNKGIKDIIIVDDFNKTAKQKNTENKSYYKKIERTEFLNWLDINNKNSKIDFIFHLGARTDTTEFDKAIFDELNLNYSKSLWKLCCKYNIPLIYASSAATYGNGENGYKDDHQLIETLKPLNPYGESKNDFDKWVLKQAETPPYWAGLKFFNIYGPNEYHKSRMASVIFHSYNQIKETGKMKLFRSHNPAFTDGGQSRDFVYVKDVVNVCFYLMLYKQNSGIYNLGTGKARSFLDLTVNVFNVLNIPANIVFIDTPPDIRDKYQYFTEANISKLLSIGYQTPFYSLETGIEDYLETYLVPKNYY
ncbi:MAG: ADP-glyceromanno-heptose 6-epimerase, partial [Bacteroidales bacterium]|nr:ADP-glyceromanno-heptose 6-epimerase [Bacteroidales bacterium]